MAERQQLKATVTLPEGLTREQIDRLKEVFTADLIAILGGSDYLKEKNISVVLNEEIFSRVIIDPGKLA
jgi:hypothetical protein